MYRKTSVIVLLLIFLISIHAFAIAKNDVDDELASVFFHEDIRIESHQHIERLLGSSSNAIVSGTITEGVIIVDGNLTLLPGAR